LYFLPKHSGNNAGSKSIVFKPSFERNDSLIYFVYTKRRRRF